MTLVGTRDILPADTWWPRQGRIVLIVGTPVIPGDGDWRDVVRIRDLTLAQITPEGGGADGMRE